MHILKNLSLSLLSLVLVATAAAPVSAYKFTIPSNPLYKYTIPSNPYKYTTPSNPYKYTTPTNPYKYTMPSNPLYKYTAPGTIYENSDTTDDQQEYDCITNSFNDISGHPAEEYIVELACMGILNGYSDGTFRPDNTITRAEILKISMMAAGLEPNGGTNELNLYFVDLGDWQAPWVNTAFELGIVEGYDSGDGINYYYAPNNSVNRAEGIKLMLATFGIYPGEMAQSSFTDVSGWMIPWVEVAYGIGIVDMPSSGKFYPASSLTRGDAATYLYRLVNSL
jgi:hypothetical protein